ncbi:hypothetical protein EDC40_108165 [Aminobacter aminovorans]|uniref:Uncharacterized protein n=1 Tax=Aminobacter aminovorans TaxID=83263 RepID=A0A381IN35_AMIAI|nr:hypothetical protein EDC40_108165 [Aminobacter aminovorans]SUY29492.1 Uncharacterised protein [Aminobacter aminovorans]
MALKPPLTHPGAALRFNLAASREGGLDCQ